VLKFSKSFYVDVNDNEGRPRAPQDDEIVRGPSAPSAIDWAGIQHNCGRDCIEPTVDVIVPVYRGLNETLRCIYSVLSAPQRLSYMLIVVNDSSPDDELSATLTDLSRRGLFYLHSNSQNLGYVRSCNLGMALHPHRDIVLLNSDTEVCGDWLDRLVELARRDKSIGTVTPFSNNATICSYPNFGQDNQLRLELSDRELDQIASEVNAHGVIDIPTGVGFCMYIKRGCLDDVGQLDYETFGRGYGEENDFCRRAASKGWRNVLAPNVFVRHYGATSFGPSKAVLVREACRTIERVHPGYLRMVDTFFKEDPIGPFRQALDLARIARRGKGGAVLFVTHNWGGGTERHVQDMAHLLENDGDPVFFCRPDPDDEDRVIVTDPKLVTPNLPRFSVARELEPFTRLLCAIRIKHVHVHHVVGFSKHITDFLRLACSRLSISYDITIHDYTPICPRINLVDRSGVYCGEPELSICERCISRDGSQLGMPPVWQWRDQFERFLANARKLFVPNIDVKRRLERWFPNLTVAVRPHPEPEFPVLKPSKVEKDTLSRIPPRHIEGSRRIAILGAIGAHKGSTLIEQTAQAARERRTRIEFIIVGYTDRDNELKAIGNVTITGRYDETDSVDLLRATNADFAWFPSVWPETYSYTLSAALKAGLHPIVFDFGAIASRLRELERGILLPLELMLDPIRLAERLLTLPKHERTLTSFKAAVYPSPVLDSYYGLARDDRPDDDLRTCGQKALGSHKEG
jgi:O-antigen biosynthesis protein